MASIEASNPSPTLSQKRILITWLPLAASWLLMAIEGPYISAALARLEDSVRMIAAFGLAASLSITIESPVISLLATSTALARSRQNYLMIRRFTLHLIIATTVLQFLLAWTPLFDLVVMDWMGVPSSLLGPVQLGLKLMLFWSAAIAWRRFKQGILIRYGRSRSVGQGTIVRLLGSAGSATLLAIFTDMPGIAVGAMALSIGVLAEAAFAQAAAASVVRERFYEEKREINFPTLSYRELVGFHWPLAASSLLFLFTQPIVSAALARGPEPELALAAWPLMRGLIFMSRAPEMAFPEVVIALNEERGSRAALSRFSLTVGLILSALLALVSLTPLANFYFGTLVGVDDQLAALSTQGLALAVLIPFIMAFVTNSRGQLTAQRTTRPQAVAMFLELVTLSAVLTAGVYWRLPGIQVAAVAMTASLAVDAIYLYFASINPGQRSPIFSRGQATFKFFNKE
ncbi:MAG: hypothetical protein ACRDFQ_04400 [Anaerolineales bacterium]